MRVEVPTVYPNLTFQQYVALHLHEPYQQAVAKEAGMRRGACTVRRDGSGVETEAQCFADRQLASDDEAPRGLRQLLGSCLRVEWTEVVRLADGGGTWQVRVKRPKVARILLNGRFDFQQTPTALVKHTVVDVECRVPVGRGFCERYAANEVKKSLERAAAVTTDWIRCGVLPRSEAVAGAGPNIGAAGGRIAEFAGQPSQLGDGAHR